MVWPMACSFWNVFPSKRPAFIRMGIFAEAVGSLLPRFPVEPRWPLKVLCKVKTYVMQPSNLNRRPLVVSDKVAVHVDAHRLDLVCLQQDSQSRLPSCIWPHYIYSKMLCILPTPVGSCIS